MLRDEAFVWYHPEKHFQVLRSLSSLRLTGNGSVSQAETYVGSIVCGALNWPRIN